MQFTFTKKVSPLDSPRALRMEVECHDFFDLLGSDEQVVERLSTLLREDLVKALVAQFREDNAVKLKNALASEELFNAVLDAVRKQLVSEIDWEKVVKRIEICCGQEVAKELLLKGMGK